MSNMHITLIGMPGAGKSTIGRLLAEELKCDLVDTDVLIKERAGSALGEFIERAGLAAFKKLEEEIILGLDPSRPTIVSTGGSVVYSALAMAHLGAISKIVFLDAPLELIEARLKNAGTRGILGLQEKGLAALYAERRPLYLQYAHRTIIIDDKKTTEEIAKEISIQPPIAQGRPTTAKTGRQV